MKEWGTSQSLLRAFNPDEILSDGDEEAELKDRPPVVTIMGHVDHGKTSLLDAFRKSRVTEGEHGGITQHVGAYQVSRSDRLVTFIDTPGHEAFTEMRARGAVVTDIIILVVAADDGIKAQTIESINHAKAAEVPVIVAVNKIDKPDCDPDMVKTSLTQHGLIPEDYGGDVVTVPVSATKGTNLGELLESILLRADVMELKGNHSGKARGVVIESRVDSKSGTVATLLVQRGTLNVGDVILVGARCGRVRSMKDDLGSTIKSASISQPVVVTGLSGLPSPGDSFVVVKDEGDAKKIVNYRERIAKDEKSKSGLISGEIDLKELFAGAPGSGAGQTKELRVVAKSDTCGSAEVVKAGLEGLSNDEVKVKILHSGVGGITLTDVHLAGASGGMVLGFNVRPDNRAREAVKNKGTTVKCYTVVYEMLEEMKARVSGMMKPVIEEKIIGSVCVREIFNVSKAGKVCGCYVNDGVVKRAANVRLLRDGVVIHDGKIKTLRRYKEDVKEVGNGFECGIVIENYSDVKLGDILEVYEELDLKV